MFTVWADKYNNSTVVKTPANREMLCVILEVAFHCVCSNDLYTSVHLL